MKVTRNTPEQLIVENNPVLIAVLITAFALVFVAVGLFIISEEFWIGVVFTLSGIVIGVAFNMAFARRTQLILDRPGNLVEMRRKSMLGYKKRTWELGHLDRAVVQSSRGDKTTTYRAAMMFSDGMDAGTHPITIVYSSGGGSERAANAINNWLRGSLDSGQSKA